MFAQAVGAAKGKKVIITETGWPNMGEALRSSEPSDVNAMSYFIDTQAWSKADDIEIDIALMYCDADSEKSLSFVNNIKTPEGGTHEAGFRAGLTNSLRSYITKNANAKEKNTKITGDDTKEGLIAIVSVRVPEPQFEGQTKTKLGSQEMGPKGPTVRTFLNNFVKLSDVPIIYQTNAYSKQL